MYLVINHENMMFYSLALPWHLDKKNNFKLKSQKASGPSSGVRIRRYGALSAEKHNKLIVSIQLA